MKLEKISQGSAWSGYITWAIGKSGRNKIGGIWQSVFDSMTVILWRFQKSCSDLSFTIHYEKLYLGLLFGNMYYGNFNTSIGK